MLNWIVWNKTVLTFNRVKQKNCTHTKLNCVNLELFIFIKMHLGLNNLYDIKSNQNWTYVLSSEKKKQTQKKKHTKLQRILEFVQMFCSMKFLLVFHGMWLNLAFFIFYKKYWMSSLTTCLIRSSNTPIFRYWLAGIIVNHGQHNTKKFRNSLLWIIKVTFQASIAL